MPGALFIASFLTERGFVGLNPTFFVDSALELLARSPPRQVDWASPQELRLTRFPQDSSEREANSHNQLMNQWFLL